MGKIEWSDTERLQHRKYNVGDEVYHGELFLGIIEEIKKPWLERSYAVMALASHEAKKFLDKELGFDSLETIQIIKAPLWLRLLRKIKRVVRSSARRMIK